MSTALSCGDDRRRGDVRAAGRNGIDSVQPGADLLTLVVGLFAEEPPDLTPANFRVEGGRRVPGIRVVGVSADATSETGSPGCVRLTLDRHGDRSTHRLCVVEAGPHGRPGSRPHPDFDPRYSCADFTFTTDCPQLVDCAPVEDCPPRTFTEPEIDHLAKDYDSFRQLVLDRMSLTVPGWTERHVPDLALTLVELLAYAGDRLSYLQDAAATEAYLHTARRRVSVRRHARLVDYPAHDGCAARAWVCLTTTEQVTLEAGDFRFAALPATGAAEVGSALLAGDLARTAPYEVFEPLPVQDVTLYPAHDRIELWAWGDAGCCLPRGATAATLVDGRPEPPPDPGTPGYDPPAYPQPGYAPPPYGGPAEPPSTRKLQLRPGDVLVLREEVGARTGAPGDADPTHCQAVRLTSVTPVVDELYRQPLLEVTWAREDALTFPLCVSSRGGPDCTDLTVGCAHGNVVLVEHGRSLTWCGVAPETHDRPAPRGELGCPDPPAWGCPVDDGPVPLPAYPPVTERFAPVLQSWPVTQSAPFPAPADLARAQAQHLLGLPDRARRRLRDLWRVAEHRALTADELADLDTLFGAATVQRLGVREHPRAGLGALLARFDELLARKLARVGTLVARARAGYVLTAADEGWEVGQAWGAQEGDDLDPARSLFLGPASRALRPDPRSALPALSVDLPEEPADPEDPYRPADRGGPWLPRRDLLDSGPTDRHVVGEVDDDGALALRFGDGRAGAAPPPGRAVQVSYRVGNGAAGNVGRNAINRVVTCATRLPGVVRVWNPLAAAGGVDPEPVAAIRQRAPYELRHRLLRAVTADDYATLAGQVPGVQRAAADLRWVGSWYEVQVAVDPLGSDTAPAWLLDAVREALQPYRRIGHDLSVRTAELVPLALTLSVQVEAGSVAGRVRQALTAVLGSGRLPDGRTGFFSPDRLSFGTAVHVSQVVAAAAGVPGVRHVEVTRLQPLFGDPGTALADGVLRMGALQVPQLDGDPTRPEHGLLTLDLRGGR